MNTNINYEKKAEALRERTREGAREGEGREVKGGKAVSSNSFYELGVLSRYLRDTKGKNRPRKADKRRSRTVVTRTLVKDRSILRAERGREREGGREGELVGRTALARKRCSRPNRRLIAPLKL